MKIEFERILLIVETESELAFSQKKAFAVAVVRLFVDVV